MILLQLIYNHKAIVGSKNEREGAASCRRPIRYDTADCEGSGDPASELLLSILPWPHRTALSVRCAAPATAGQGDPGNPDREDRERCRLWHGRRWR